MAELAYLAVRELGMELVGIVDPENAGKSCVDHEIQDLAWLEDNGHADVLLVLNSVSKNRDLMNQIAEIASNHNMQYVSCR